MKKAKKKLRIVVKQNFNKFDEALFRADMLINSVDTIDKQKEYVV